MEFFLVKKHAISYLNNRKDPNIRLFQEDTTIEHTKRFLVGTYDAAYNLIIEGRNNLYESWIENTPMYFGIDLDIKERIDKKEEIKIIKHIITCIIELSKEKFKYNYNVKDFYVSKTENQPEKLSVHITCRGLIFQNYKGCKEFYDLLMKKYNIKGIDDSIYRLTCLRTTFCTKLNKDCILKPYSLKIGREVTAKCKNDKEFWLKSLITNIELNKTIIPNKIKKKIKEDTTIDYTSNNIQLEALLFKLPEVYCNSYDKWIKVGWVCYNDNKKNYDIFDKWSKQSSKYNSVNNKKIWNSFKSSSNKLTVGSLIYWLKENNISMNDILPSIKDIVDNYPENKIIISPEYKVKEINKNKLDVNDIKYGYNSKLFCIQSEKGTGKTTSLIKYLFENNIKNIPESILFVSSRRTFGIKLLNDLEKYGFKLYSNIEEQYIGVKRIIIQINSLTRLVDMNYDLIIIDECESLARYLTSSHFMKNNNSSIIISELEYRIKNSNKTIIMDADLSDRCINYYKNVLEIDNSNFKILKNKKTPYSDYTIKYTNHTHWVSIILDKINDNKKLVIPMASNNKAKDLKEYINTLYPEKNVLLIHKETNEKEKLARLLNVNNDWVKYDIVIYTPTVCMGVSFDVPKYFDYIFAYGCHESLGSQEFSQMIHRVREPKNKEIYISIDNYKMYDITEDIITYKTTEEMVCSQYYLTKFDIHNNLIPKKYGKERVLIYPYKNEVLYDLYIRNSMERIADLNNFTACFFGYCKYKKYKIEYIDEQQNNMCKEDLKDLAKKRKEIEQKKYIENILKAENLTSKEYKEKIMRKDEFMDDDTLFAIKKRNLYDCYDLTNFNQITDEFIKEYSDKNVMINYNNLKTILHHNNQTTDNKLKILKINEKYNINYLSIYEEFKNKNKFIYHYYPYILLKFIGYNINNIDNNNLVDSQELNNRLNNKIENITLKEFLEKEKNSILYQYNLKRTNIDYNEPEKIINFINKIIKKQYGIILKKKNNKYTLTTNKLWDKIDREQKILTKEIKSVVLKDKNKENVSENLDKIIL